MVSFAFSKLFVALYTSVVTFVTGGCEKASKLHFENEVSRLVLLPVDILSRQQPKERGKDSRHLHYY